MKLSVYTIDKTLFTGMVTSVSLPTPLGEITILDHHLPMIAKVSEGNIRFTLPDNKNEGIAFGGGIVEVRPDSEVVVLAQETSS